MMLLYQSAIKNLNYMKIHHLNQLKQPRQPRQPQQPQRIIRFRPLKMPLQQFSCMNSLMIVINTYAIFIESKNTFLISLFTYIYGMMIVCRNTTVYQPYKNKCNSSLFVIYFINIGIWYCQLTNLGILFTQQLLVAFFISIYYFSQEIIIALKVIFNPILLNNPQFQQIFMTSQSLTLKYYFTSIFQMIFNSNRLRMIRMLPYILRLIQSSKKMKVQPRQYVIFFRLICSIISISIQKYTYSWYTLKIIVSSLLIYNDIFVTWKIERIKQANSKYKWYVYLIAFIINFYGRIYWYLNGINSSNVQVQVNSKLAWNLINIDAYYVNFLNKRKNNLQTNNRSKNNLQKQQIFQ